jgi:hypothetical protein
MRSWLLLIALLGCTPKPDRDARCKDVVEHLRKVSMAPMRDGDVSMLTGACKMWSEGTIDCVLATKDDAGVETCKLMEKR